MTHRLAFVTGLLLLASAVVGSPVKAEGGLGVYPSAIELGNATRGGEYYRDVGILNSGKTDLVVVAVPEGEVGTWVTFHSIEDRATPLKEIKAAANEETRLLIRIRVPGDAANQDYRGGVMLQSEVARGEVGAGESATGIALGLAMDLRVVVSGVQRLEGRIRDLHSDDTEVGYPLRVRTFFENTGNVSAKPQINYVIKNAAGGRVADGAVANTVVYPGENAFITAEWDTTGQQSGDYTASIAVMLGDRQIHAEEHKFKVLPRGTLTRQGLFTGLQLSSQPVPGAATKIRAGFTNIGQIDTKAVFIGELYRGTVLAQAIVSPEKLVVKGTEDSIEVFLNPLEAGTYTLRGKVNFEGKESDIQELTFTIESQGIAMWVWGGAGGSALLLVGIIALVLARKFGSRKTPKAAQAS